MQVERDDFPFPLREAGLWVLAASRCWTLLLTNKLHLDPRGNANDTLCIFIYSFQFMYPKTFSQTYCYCSCSVLAHMTQCDTNEYARSMAQWFYSPVESALGLVLK